MINSWSKELQIIIFALTVSGLQSNNIAHPREQGYTQKNERMNKGVTPYAFGANINGTWRDLGTVSAAGSWSIPSSSLSFTQTGAGAVTRTVNAKIKDYKVTPQDFSLTAGNGGDDTAAIQAAINAVIAAGGGTVYFPTPSSGNYNICGGGLSIVPPAYTTTEIHLEGNGEGLTSVRIAPTCAAPPLQMLYILNGFSNFANPINTKSNARISINHLRLDGYCKATYNINNAYSVQLSIKNSVLRNVKVAANSANYNQTGGYETYIDGSVRLENINDAGNTCYSAGSLPDYNLAVTSSDNHFYAMAVGAKKANFYQANGGNNDFSHSHAWGYGVPNVDNQPDSRPEYNYVIRGSATIVGAVADSFTLGGFYLSNVTATGGNNQDGGQLIGARCMGVVDANSSCITIDNTTYPLINWVISGNNTQGITTAGSPVKIIGALNASTTIRDNAWSLNSTPIYIGGGSLGTQALNLTSDAGNSYIAAAAASGVGSADANLKVSTNGTGGVIQHLVAGNAIQTIAGNMVYFNQPLTVGIEGTTVGSVAFKNATSGTITLQPTTGALGTVTATLPANTGTIAETNLAQTFSATQAFTSGVISAGTKPTATGAGGTCAAGTVTGGALVGTVELKGSCVSTNTLALTGMPTATTGYVCDAADRTSGVLNLVQTATTTTGATFTFNATTGATDVIQFKCLGY